MKTIALLSVLLVGLLVQISAEESKFALSNPTFPGWVYVDENGQIDKSKYESLTNRTFVLLNVQTNVSTNLTPVSVTTPIVPDYIKELWAEGKAIGFNTESTVNYSTNVITNRTASFSFEGKTYHVELK